MSEIPESPRYLPTLTEVVAPESLLGLLPEHRLDTALWAPEVVHSVSPDKAVPEELGDVQPAGWSSLESEQDAALHALQAQAVSEAMEKLAPLLEARLRVSMEQLLQANAKVLLPALLAEIKRAVRVSVQQTTGQ